MSYSFKISLISLKSKVIITPYSKKYATFLLYTGLNFLGGLCNSEPDGKGIATLSIVSSKGQSEAIFLKQYMGLGTE